MSKFTGGIIEVVPAYGRSYLTKKSAVADWQAGKDFQDPSTGQYVNKSDAERFDLGVIVRFGRYNEKVGTLR